MVDQPVKKIAFCCEVVKIVDRWDGVLLGYSPLYNPPKPLLRLVAVEAPLGYTYHMKRYVKPTSDLFIPYLWGSEQNKDILLDFINTMLTDYHFGPAVSLSIRNPFNLKELPDAKESVVDVKAQDETGRLFTVEIQVIGNRFYTKRSLYYWAKT